MLRLLRKALGQACIQLMLPRHYTLQPLRLQVRMQVVAPMSSLPTRITGSLDHPDLSTTY